MQCYFIDPFAFLFAMLHLQNENKFATNKYWYYWQTTVVVSQTEIFLNEDMVCVILCQMTCCIPNRNAVKYFITLSCVSKAPLMTLQWRHYERSGVSNHQPRDCLLKRLFRRRSKKTAKLRVTGLCEGNSPMTGEFPHKGPVTRKMFPFDDVIMGHRELAWRGSKERV